MGENTKIEWADHTWNPWIGCMKVSPGCDRCYAESLAKRYGWVEWGQRKTEETAASVGGRKRTSEENWRKPLRWARKAREAMEDFETGMITLRPPRPRVFCASLADVFDNQVPEGWRADLFALIMKTPEIDWLLLTKRPENIMRMMHRLGGVSPPWPNVWLGFTAENQEHFDKRWPIVRDIPAAVRFCSYEPAIGPLRLPRDAGRLQWLICGGESGPGHRPFYTDWEANIRRDCARENVAYFLKQFSGKKPLPVDYPVVRQFPSSARVDQRDDGCDEPCGREQRDQP